MILFLAIISAHNIPAS